ncbi:MAG: glycosyltransferase [Magnetovibrionaceae bacterium]
MTSPGAKPDVKGPDIQGKHIVVLTAVYNDWESLALLLPEIDHAFAGSGARVDVVVVDDGSAERGGRDSIPGLELGEIRDIHEIELASNQGNQRALAIGVAHIAENLPCDYLVVMDADHEDKPEDIPSLLSETLSEEQPCIIFAGRGKRTEGRLFAAGYSIFRLLYRALTGIRIQMGNFSVVPGSMVARLAHQAPLWHHYSSAILRSKLPYRVVPKARGTRRLGQSGMNPLRLIVHAFSGLTVFADIAAVRLILTSIVLAGLVLTGAIVVALLKLGTDLPIVGWTSIFAGILLVMVAQALAASLNLLFMVLFLKSQPAMIPAHDYRRFILREASLRPLSETPPEPS